jgi:hypothetical protein
MRPIDKGAWPLDRNGQRRIFQSWTLAIPILEEQTGVFCHICEARFPLTIDHLKFKDRFPRLSLNWWNFLLTCQYCNSRKGVVVIKNYRQAFVWPHLNNTFLALDYHSDGSVCAASNISPIDIERASSLIELYQLSSPTTKDGKRDRRFLRRLDAYRQAEERLHEYKNGKATVRAILDAATNTGFFSIWLKVFEAIQVVRDALINCPAFHLVGKGFFDENGNAIPRNGQAI